MLRPFQFGNKAFFWKGKLVLGKRNKRFLFSLFILIFLPILLLSLESSYYSSSGDYAFISLTLILQILSLILMLTCTLMDPGILKVPLTEEEQEKINVKIVQVKSLSFALVYCRTCKIFRPIRSHHCNICDVCVDELDHHCSWVGNCVGKRTRKKFIFFLLTLNCLLLTLIIYTGCNLEEEVETYYTKNSFSNRLVWLTLFMIFELIVELFLFILTIFHFYLIFNAITTYEYFKNLYTNTRNPFNAGYCNNLNDFILRKTEGQSIDLDYLIKKEEIDYKSDTSSSGADSKNDSLALNMTITETNNNISNAKLIDDNKNL